jgi:hypothetical protein
MITHQSHNHVVTLRWLHTLGRVGAPTSLLPAEVALAAWALCYAVIMLATRPRRRVASGSRSDSPQTVTLPAPALAALLTRANGSVPRVAPVATLLDLVARRMVIVTCDPHGHQWYSAAKSAALDADREPVLLSFERHVLDHVATRAQVGGGAVPLAGLRLESGQHAKRWYAQFNRQVVSEARRLGLAADRGAWPLRALLRLALLVPAVLAAVVALRGDGGWTLVMYIVFGYSAATLPVRLLDRVVPRGAGIAAAAGCRSMRAELSRYPPGDNAPPGDRRPAYAMAFGLTAPQRGATPFEPGGDLVWSPWQGRWVRVVPRRALSFGASPMVAVIGFVPALLVSGIWGVLLGGVTQQLTWSQVARVWPVPLLVLGWVVWVWGNFLFARWFYRSVYDLVVPPVTVIGQVVYLESAVSSDSETPDNYYVAVDDGRTDRITRYEITRGLHDRLRYGSWLSLQVRPRLGSLVRADVLPTPEASRGVSGWRPAAGQRPFD